MADTPLLGRADAVEAIGELLDRAAAGDGGTLWFEGEAGIGKTRLLAQARPLAAGRFLVLATTGYESEVDLAWSGLLSIVEPLLAGDLAAPQRAAIDAALHLAGADEPVEPFAVVLAVRNLLLDASEGRPVLLLVDDAHWLDESTRLVVDHLARRSSGLPVAVVAASRPATPGAPVDAVELGPVGDDAATELLVQAGVDSPEVRSRLVQELGGRPLLLLAAAARLAVGDTPAATPVPLPPTVLELAADRLDGLDPAARFPLLVAATVAGGDQDTIARALAAEGLALDALDTAEAAGILAFGGGRVAFTHPTLRSAAYHGATASDRRRAHRLVGRVSDAPDTQALHLALGAEGPDAELLGRVEAAADALHARGAPVEAARAHELAARLADQPEAAARQLRLAAELLVDTPEADAVLDLLDRAALVDRSAAEQARAEKVRLRWASRQGDSDAAIDGLQSLAGALAGDEPALATGLLLEALPSLIRQRRAVDIFVVSKQAHELAATCDDRGVRLRADIALGGSLVAAGDPAGGPLIERYHELLDEEGLGAGPFLAEVTAPILGFLHRTDDVRVLLDRLEADLRRRGALPVLASVLAAKAAILHGPDLPGTIAAAEEAIALAEELRHPGLVEMPAASLAVAAAMRGDAERTATACAVVEACGGPVNRQTAEIARGALALGHGRLDEALVAYEWLAAEAGLGRGHLRWEPEWAESLIRAQRREDARRVLDDLEASGGPGWAVAGVARIEGMLADDEDVAAERFRTSVDLMALARNDVGEGRTELVWGERLRRARRRAAARPHLERALELLTRCGASVWAERAAAELALAGGVAAASGTEELTAQELHVARLAASGATNRDIGHELFVSPRTVEAHLTTVFRKLGVRNRRELSALALEDERLRS